MLLLTASTLALWMIGAVAAPADNDKVPLQGWQLEGLVRTSGLPTEDARDEPLRRPMMNVRQTPAIAPEINHDQA